MIFTTDSNKTIMVMLAWSPNAQINKLGCFVVVVGEFDNQLVEIVQLWMAQDKWRLANIGDQNIR